MAQTGLVTFKGQLNEYAVYITENGGPEHVAKALEQAGITNGHMYDYRRASQVATDFVRAHANAVWSEKNGRPTAQHVYTVFVDYNKVFYNHDATCNCLQQLKNLASPTASLKNAIDKVVRFTYKDVNGKQERIVKVTSVLEKPNGTSLLKGWDVQKSTGDKLAYRSYRVNNIVGKVEVIG